MATWCSRSRGGLYKNKRVEHFRLKIDKTLSKVADGKGQEAQPMYHPSTIQDCFMGSKGGGGWSYRYSTGTVQVQLTNDKVEKECILPQCASLLLLCMYTLRDAAWLG